ncbi:MAG: hypothetical protein ACHQ49_02230 [Elusimicrobiota bacterium]
MILSNKTLACFGAAGTLSDAVGGIYLTYDLLGGRTGPLGLVTRAATYGFIFGLGYGLAFGPAFGTIAGIGLGAILAVEFWRVAYFQRTYGYSPLYNIGVLGGARGVVLGLASVPTFGWRFGAVFGSLSAVLLAIVYRLHFSPTHDYQPAEHFEMRRRPFLAGLARAAAVGTAGAATGWIEAHRLHAMAFGLTIGVAVGLIIWVVTIVSPRVEWYIEHLPERHLALYGFALVGLGLILQSVQYVVVILGPN